jgi:hypothetical protein
MKGLREASSFVAYPAWRLGIQRFASLTEDYRSRTFFNAPGPIWSGL